MKLASKWVTNEIELILSYPISKHQWLPNIIFSPEWHDLEEMFHHPWDPGRRVVALKDILVGQQQLPEV